MTPDRPGEVADVLVNCDDFGMHPAINEAIAELLSEGIVRSASLMAVGQYFEHAVQQLKSLDIREIGVHLTLGSEYPALPTRPVSEAVPSLVLGDGTFHPDIRPVRDRLNLAEVRRELELQIQRVLAHELSISHLDGHMFFYEPDEGGAALFDLVRSLAGSLGVPFRGDRGGARGPAMFLWDEVPGIPDRVRLYHEALRDGSRRGAEIIIHPARDSSSLRAITRSVDWRHADYLAFRREALEGIVPQGVRFLTWTEFREQHC